MITKWMSNLFSDSDDKSVGLKNTKTNVKIPKVFSAAVGINLIYHKLPTENFFSMYTTKIKCKTQEDFIEVQDSVRQKIKTAGELLKNAGEDDIVTLFDSLVIKKSQFISMALEASVDQQ